MYIISALVMSLWISFVYIFEASTKFSCHAKDRESAITTLGKRNKLLLFLAFAGWAVFVSIA